MQWANPRSLILNIEGATDQLCLENYSRSRYKIFTSYHFKKKWMQLHSLLLNNILFLSTLFKFQVYVCWFCYFIWNASLFSNLSYGWVLFLWSKKCHWYFFSDVKLATKNFIIILLLQAYYPSPNWFKAHMGGFSQFLDLETKPLNKLSRQIDCKNQIPVTKVHVINVLSDYIISL